MEGVLFMTFEKDNISEEHNNLINIWMNRLNNNSNSQDNTKSLFNYDLLNNTDPYDINFNENNHNDNVIGDFMKLLQNIMYQHDNNKCKPISIEINNTYVTYISSKEFKNDTFFINSKDERFTSIIINIYNAHNNIEYMNNIDGRPTNIINFTNMLIDLGLIESNDYFNDY